MIPVPNEPPETHMETSGAYERPAALANRLGPYLRLYARRAAAELVRFTERWTADEYDAAATGLETYLAVWMPGARLSDHVMFDHSTGGLRRVAIAETTRADEVALALRQAAWMGELNGSTRPRVVPALNLTRNVLTIRSDYGHINGELRGILSAHAPSRSSAHMWTLLTDLSEDKMLRCELVRVQKDWLAWKRAHPTELPPWDNKPARAARKKL